MAEFPLDGWQVAGAAWALLITIFTGLSLRHNSRVDRHDARISTLENTMVTRAELKDAFESMRRDRKEMHEENRGALNEIGRKIDATNGTVQRLAIGVARLDTEGRLGEI